VSEGGVTYTVKELISMLERTLTDQMNSISADIKGLAVKIDSEGERRPSRRLGAPHGCRRGKDPEARARSLRKFWRLGREAVGGQRCRRGGGQLYRGAPLLHRPRSALMKHYFVPLNGIQWLTLVLLVAVSAGFAYGFNQAKDQRAALAHVQAHQGDSVRTTFCYFESLGQKSKRLTPAQKRQEVKVIRKALAKIGEPDCTHP
jgi:hypothetical protein